MRVNVVFALLPRRIGNDRKIGVFKQINHFALADGNAVLVVARPVVGRDLNAEEAQLGVVEALAPAVLHNFHKLVINFIVAHVAFALIPQNPAYRVRHKRLYHAVKVVARGLRGVGGGVARVKVNAFQLFVQQLGVANCKQPFAGVPALYA